jgi:hypothetical protein
MVLTYG